MTLKDLTKFLGEKPFEKPFSLVDSEGFHWSIATDRSVLFAIKGSSSAPRFKGPFTAVARILEILKVELPSNLVNLGSVTLPEEGYYNVLGVVVDFRLIQNVCKELQVQTFCILNSTEAIGSPSLMFAGANCLALVMGCEGDFADVPTFEFPKHVSDLDLFMEE